MKTIELTDEQYQAFSNGEPITLSPPNPKPTLWHPKSCDWVVGPSKVLRSRSLEPTNRFGLEYETKEKAIKARDAMRTHNRLLAWLSENDDGWVADWGNSCQKKFYVYYNYSRLSWCVTINDCHETLGVVYMSEPNALKLCELLNSGVVEL